eukprot:SAG11_NODE_121_length_15851_cov_6.082466_6_plen_137_part_00
MTQLRLVELPGGQFSRHLVGDGMAEVKSLGTRECEELRIARIVQVCYGISGHPELGIDEGLEHATDSLHECLKAFGLSKREVAAVIWLLDAEGGSGADEDGGDGTLSGESLRSHATAPFDALHLSLLVQFKSYGVR